MPNIFSREQRAYYERLLTINEDQKQNEQDLQTKNNQAELKRSSILNQYVSNQSRDLREFDRGLKWLGKNWSMSKRDWKNRSVLVDNRIVAFFVLKILHRCS